MESTGEVTKQLEELKISESQLPQTKEAMCNKVSHNKVDIVQAALKLKEEGNQFFRDKDYPKARGKYVRVQCYTNAILPAKDAQVQAFQSMSKAMHQNIVSGKELEETQELVATTLLNMATCYYLEKNYPKCIEKATLSLEHQKSIKAYYRRGKAYAIIENYENAVKDFEDAVKLDPSDPNDIQQELVQVKHKSNDAEKKRINKMQGFLLKDNE